MVRFKFSKGSGFKKYRVVISDKGKKIKTVQFGDRRYGQYKDKTSLKLYSKKDTLDPKRRKAYYARHQIGRLNVERLVIGFSTTGSGSG